ncbi:acetyl-CoA carboxylase carboxyl transferase subunit alpha, partial [Akkermansiaceae bacterium]|nr:acetyl-CoA carboxylase carboxyl transferase subunit alpha [Akkermansiaceae bacterium]
MELLEFEKPIAELEKELELLQNKSRSQDIDLSSEISAIEGKLTETRREIYENLSPWQRVQIARHTKRPYMLDYIARS